MFFDCHKPIAIKYITRIRLGLSHLQEHIFKHSFQDTINPICNWGNDIESAIHFLHHCPLYSNERCMPLSSLVKIDHNLLDNTNFWLIQTLMFGNTAFNTKNNIKIIHLATDFVLSTTRLNAPLLQTVFFCFFCLLPEITIHQRTKEAYLRWVQDSWRHQRLFSSWEALDTTTKNSAFDAVEVFSRGGYSFFRRFFYFNSKF